MSSLILCFHRIANPLFGGRSKLAISERDFEKVLDQVGRSYEFVPLVDLERPSRTRRAVITFDDGYADNLYRASPILLARGIPASFFVSTGYVGTNFLFLPDALDRHFSDVSDEVARGLFLDFERDDYWTTLAHIFSLPREVFWEILGQLSNLHREDVISEDPYRRPMSGEELRRLSTLKGFSLGPHTVSHRRLSSLHLREAMEEFLESVEWLTRSGFSPVPFFAYPFGQVRDFSTRLSRELRRQGFEPLSTQPFLENGFSRLWLGGHGLPRLSVGPQEVALLSTVLAMLPLMTILPPVTNFLLRLRRSLNSVP